jgi:hypothetical protein
MLYTFMNFVGFNMTCNTIQLEHTRPPPILCFVDYKKLMCYIVQLCVLCETPMLCFEGHKRFNLYVMLHQARGFET